MAITLLHTPRLPLGGHGGCPMLRTTIVLAVILASVATAAAQTGEIIGRIERIEPDQQLIVLANGQMYRVTPNTVLYVNNQPVALNTLRPGQNVVIRTGEPVALSNPPATVVVAPPATAVPVGVRHTIYGRIKDINEDGTVKIATGRDSFKVQLSQIGRAHV